MRNILLTATLCFAAALCAPQALAQDHDHGHEHGEMKQHAEKKSGDTEQALPKCPVTGEPVNFTVSTMTDDGPVYFCCPRCISKFKEKPERFSKQVTAQRKALAKMDRVQVTCPLSGKPINPKVYLEVDDQKVYFCCSGCRGQYKQDPSKYAAKLAASYTYQTKCPVMGGEINPAAFIDLPTDERIYFCCAGCDKKFRADPEKYEKNLTKQGIRLDMKKLKRELAEQKKDDKES